MKNNKKINFKINFIGIGAEKCGTTWIADMLKQHPEIFIPKQKELHYFNEKFVENPTINNPDYNRDLSWYKSFFKNNNRNTNIKMGEICPSYLWDKKAAKNIFNFNPKIKLIIILRNPADRTYSQYLYYLQRGAIPQKKLSELLKDKKYQYLIERSMYYSQIKKYFDLFPKKNIKILFYEDLRKNPEKILEDIEKFLKIKRYIPKNLNAGSNVTGISRFNKFNNLTFRIRNFLIEKNMKKILSISRFIGLSRFVEKIRNDYKKNYKNKPQMDKKSIIKLKKKFSKDIDALEKLLKKDLSHWR